MRNKAHFLLAASVCSMAILTAKSACAQNIFTLEPYALIDNPAGQDPNPTFNTDGSSSTRPGTGLQANNTVPGDVSTAPDGHGGIEVTINYEDTPGTVEATGVDAVLDLLTWDGLAQKANFNLAGFTNFELQFTNLDPNGGAYVQPVLKIGANYNYISGDSKNGGAGSIGAYNDGITQANGDPDGAATYLINWNLTSSDNVNQDANIISNGEPGVWATDIQSVREIDLEFWTPNNTVPPSGGAEFDIDPVPLIAGDLNGDGVVNNADLAIMMANLPAAGATPANVGYGSYTVGDLNSDAIVNADDFSLFAMDIAEYNASQPSSAPEPACLGLIAIAGVALARRRRWI